MSTSATATPAAPVTDAVLRDDWHPLILSDSLADGGVQASRLLGQDLVLWRTGGRVCAWQDLCIHRGAKLSMGKVKGTCLACPYHGWEYNSAGRCVKFPAHPEQTPPPRAAARTFLCQERYGLVWVCLGNPQQDVPTFPEGDNPAFRTIISAPAPVNASAPRIMENALDLAHVPFVHNGTLGDANHAEVNAYTVELTSEGIRVHDYQVYERDTDGTGTSARVSYEVHLKRPFTLYSYKITPSGKFAIFLPLTPVDHTRTIQWFLSATDYAHDMSLADFAKFHDPIMAEDVGVVESQRPELLPLDLGAELHLRCDRVTVLYRQWLRSLNLSFGTS